MFMAYFILPGFAEVYLNSKSSGILGDRVEGTTLIFTSLYILIFSLFFILFYYFLSAIFPFRKYEILDPSIYWNTFLTNKLYFFTFLSLFILVLIYNQEAILGFTHYLGNLKVSERSINSLSYNFGNIKMFLYFFYPLAIIFILKLHQNYFKKFILITLLIIITFRTSFGGAAGLMGPIFILLAYYVYNPYLKVNSLKVLIYIFLFIIISYTFKELTRYFILYDTLSFEKVNILRSLYYNIHGFQSLALLIEYPERSICSYCNFFDVFFPRFIFPDKGTDLTLGFYFTNVYWFDYISDFVDQATSITVIGESYLNFGMGGFLVSFFLALLTHFMHRIFNLSTKSPIYLWLATILFFDSFHYIYSFSSWLAMLLKKSIFFITIIIFFKQLKVIKK